MTAPESWLQRLYGLVARFPEYGIGADTIALSSADLWGVYRFLSRVADGA